MDVQTFDFNKLPDSGILLLKIDDPQARLAISHTLFNNPEFKEKLGDKKLDVMIVGTNDSIDVLGEDEMAEIGWKKREEDGEKRFSIAEIKEFLSGFKWSEQTTGCGCCDENSALENCIDHLECELDGIDSVTERMKRAPNTSCL